MLVSRLKKTKSSRKYYCRPEITIVWLDNSISLVMMTTMPPNPPPLDDASKRNNDSFASPFDKKPFG